MADQNGNVEEVNHYYPFGGVFANTSSIQPYKYNGKELDKENGLNWYDYGARQYDAALGRWNAADPMSEKYYSTSPYTYCINNPVKFVDKDGKDIVIWYGNNRSFTFNGTNQNMAPKDPYVQSFITAYNYDIKNGGGDNLRSAAMDRNKIFEVRNTEGKSFSGHDGDNLRRPILFWNSLLGLETEEKKRLSPATVLEHEMDHLRKDVMTSDKDYGEYNKTIKLGSDSQYRTKEERRVITGSEAKTARANGEYPKSYMRKNHKGNYIITQGPISNIKVREVDF